MGVEAAQRLTAFSFVQMGQHSARDACLLADTDVFLRQREQLRVVVLELLACDDGPRRIDADGDKVFLGLSNGTFVKSATFPESSAVLAIVSSDEPLKYLKTRYL